MVFTPNFHKTKWGTLLGYTVGIHSWDILLGYTVGICCWDILLGYTMRDKILTAGLQAAAERRGNNLKGRKDFCLKAKARIWP